MCHTDDKRWHLLSLHHTSGVVLYWWQWNSPWTDLSYPFRSHLAFRHCPPHKNLSDFDLHKCWNVVQGNYSSSVFTCRFGICICFVCFSLTGKLMVWVIFCNLSDFSLLVTCAVVSPECRLPDCPGCNTNTALPSFTRETSVLGTVSFVINTHNSLGPHCAVYSSAQASIHFHSHCIHNNPNIYVTNLYISCRIFHSDLPNINAV